MEVGSRSAGRGRRSSRCSIIFADRRRWQIHQFGHVAADVGDERIAIGAARVCIRRGMDRVIASKILYCSCRCLTAQRDQRRLVADQRPSGMPAAERAAAAAIGAPADHLMNGVPWRFPVWLRSVWTPMPRQLSARAK